MAAVSRNFTGAVDPIVEELTLARQARGLTQIDVCQALGYSIGVVGHYERGNRNPPLSEVRAIAELLGFELTVVRREADVSAPHRLSDDELADALRRLVSEAADRLEGIR